MKEFLSKTKEMFDKPNILFLNNDKLSNFTKIERKNYFYDFSFLILNKNFIFLDNSD